MATARTPSSDPPAPDNGFNETQRSQLSEMIAQAVSGNKPPPSVDAPTGPRKVTDGEWDDMTDRKRESWVRELVDFRLLELEEKDEVRRLAQKVNELGQSKPEPEVSPGITTRLQKLIWGDRA